MTETITLHYHRPPDRTDVFVQELLHASADVIVTYLASTPMKRPLRVRDRVVLDDGSPAVWFTFPGLMHDVGRFHTPAGEFTGLYANILEPVRLDTPRSWHATDLFLDLWVEPDAEPVILDEDELAEALAAGWVSAAQAARARAEAERIVALCHAGHWPPAIVNEWPLERVSRDTGSFKQGTT